MKKLLFAALVALSLAVPVLAITSISAQAASPAAFAAVDVFPDCANSRAAKTDVCTAIQEQRGSSTNPIISIIKAAINIISIVVGAAAIIGILASSIRMMVSNGDSGTIATARSGLIYSLVGVAVVVLAQAIVAFVLDKV